MNEDLGLVVDHVDCSMFLSHLKLEDTVERLPSRHLTLSLCLEDVKAQCDSLTPQTRERLQGILFQREVDISTNVPLAHAHGYLKISRNPLLRVHRDIPVRCETIYEGDSRSAAMETTGQTDKIEFEGHEHIVQLLEKGGAGAKLPAVFETDDTTTKSCQQGKFLGLSTVADVQRNSPSLGKGQRRNLSSMTKLLSTIFAAAQFLGSSCADCWNRAVRFGRPDLLEICVNSDSRACELPFGMDTI